MTGAHFPIVNCTACDRNMIWVEIAEDSARCCCDNCGQIFKIVPLEKIDVKEAWERASHYPVVQATFGAEQ